MHLLTSLLITFAVGAESGNNPSKYFKITVVDEQTGRGVPLVELKTINNIRYYTDSNGIVAFHEPGLMDRDVFFLRQEPRLRVSRRRFRHRGQGVSQVAGGGSAELKIKRINIAERLYRITGGGIYRDSVLTGHPVPIRSPCSTATCSARTAFRPPSTRGSSTGSGVIRTGRVSAGQLPHGRGDVAPAADGGLDPDVGVDLTYFVRENGFAKEMAPRPEPGPVWLGCLRDAAGRDRTRADVRRVRARDAGDGGRRTRADGVRRRQSSLRESGRVRRGLPVHPGGHPFAHAEAASSTSGFRTRSRWCACERRRSLPRPQPI